MTALAIIAIVLLLVVAAAIPSIFLFGAMAVAAWKAFHGTLAVRTAVIVCLLAALPMLHWAYARQAALGEAAAADPFVATVKLAGIPDALPTDLVIPGNNGAVASLPVTLPLGRIFFGDIECDGRLRAVKAAYERTDRGWQPIDATPPSRFLLLVSRDCSKLMPKGAVRWAYGGPYELRIKSPSHSDLIAYWFKRYVVVPRPYPILTLLGWLPVGNSGDSRGIWASQAAFLDRELTRICTEKPKACQNRTVEPVAPSRKIVRTVQ